jgi:phage FluMu gp28-like protein
VSTVHLKAHSAKRSAKREGDALVAASLSRASLSLFLPYQVAWIQDESTVAFWEKSRRIGADWTEAFRVVRERMNGTRTCDYWYSSADESAAVEFMVYVIMWARDVYGAVLEMVTGVEVFDGRDIKVMSVVLPEVNGRRPRITAMASSPKSFRSKGGDVGLSEYAFHEKADALWQASTPVTMWGGRIRVISSHNGVDSKFNEFLGQARRYTEPETYGQPRKTDIRASVHRVTIHDAIAQGLVERINAVTGESLTREQFLDREQAKCGDPAKWREEYECVPSEEAASFFPYELLRQVATDRVVTCGNANAFIASVIAGAEGADELYGGCDVGRRSDLFAVWVRARFGGVLRTIAVFAARDIAFGQMESVLVRLMGIEAGGAGGGVRRMAIDATGLGMQLAERMAERFRYRVEPVTITASVKEDLVTTARRHFEERTATLPDDVGVLAEYNSFRKELTSAGNIRYVSDATSEGHADRAFADLLSLHAAKRPAARMRAVSLLGGALA